jgi:hypothetical protein
MSSATRGRVPTFEFTARLEKITKNNVVYRVNGEPGENKGFGVIYVPKDSMSDPTHPPMGISAVVKLQEPPVA